MFQKGPEHPTVVGGKYVPSLSSASSVVGRTSSFRRGRFFDLAFPSARLRLTFVLFAFRFLAMRSPFMLTGKDSAAYRRTSPHKLTAKTKPNATKIIKAPYRCCSTYCLNNFCPRHLPSKFCCAGMVRPYSSRRFNSRSCSRRVNGPSAMGGDNL